MRVAVLALTPLARDARVIRSATALAEAGHDITVIGREPAPDDAPFGVLSLPPAPSAARQRAELVAIQAPATLVPLAAHTLYWWPAERRTLLKLALKTRPDVILCNDWLTLPVGSVVKQKTGATLVYDSHEYATREHIQNWKWRIVSRAAVGAIERRNVARSDLVLTVSDGIADALQRDYGLSARPTVVRNLPNFTTTSSRPLNTRRQVLFHGVIRAERGLEELIDSAPLWRFDGEIVIRGYGSGTYIDRLVERARRQGVADRLSIAPAEPPDQLIQSAASADIGYLALPPLTEHYEFALPNKLFEYLLAGLPVIATRRTEIRRVLEETGAGAFFDNTAEALATALNDLSPDRLTAMRQAALSSARILNWEHEKNILVEAVEEAHSRRLHAGP